MFWRFGFHNTSSIDSLLDKEDISLEAILDEDDLLQECKAQNTRLIDYFQRVDVLQRLLGYVSGQIEGGDEVGHFKYPHVATEVLCSEIWSIVETCVNSQAQLLVPFWETVLETPPEEMKTRTVMASHFAKINAVFMSKKPSEMLAFIRSQPLVIERLLCHIETSSFVDLLVRIIQLDEQPGAEGVLEWLSANDLIGKLVELLSPMHTPDVHAVVSDLLKGILSMSTPTPGSGLGDLQTVAFSNRFPRELASPATSTRLASYILNDFKISDFPEDPEGVLSSQLPTFQSSSSSVVQSITVLTELIRRSNSDYFEPYLFHTLRNRLIQIQQQLQPGPEDGGRNSLEEAMQELVERMGVVPLGNVLEVLMDRLHILRKYLMEPRTMTGPVRSTVGTANPLTFERFRICELFAELLHCSNMSLLNRSPEYAQLYDSAGRLRGGLSALGDLANVISVSTGNDRAGDEADQEKDEVEPSLELPVSSSHDTVAPSDSDDDLSDTERDGISSDEDVMEEVSMSDDLTQSGTFSTPPATPPSLSPVQSTTELSSEGSPKPPRTSKRQNSNSSEGSTLGRRSRSRSSPQTLRSSIHMESSLQLPFMSIGERLKQKFLDLNVFSTMLDLFFEFPWNNFLHSSVYDIIHQALMGVLDKGLNRELVVSLFRDAKLASRILEGQRLSDAECAKPKGVRLGYMGHLMLMSEDVVTALERFPPDLSALINQHVPQPSWDEFVQGRYQETRLQDNQLLGGGKPVLSDDPARGVRWKVDEEESTGAKTQSSVGEGTFRRVTDSRLTRESSADFGPPDSPSEDDSTESAPQFARYLAHEMNSSDRFGSSGSDDDDDDGGWLTQSTFTLQAPPLSARHDATTQSGPSEFEDTFNPLTRQDHGMNSDPFASDEDDFGQFSGASSVSFPSSVSKDDLDFDSSFDSFGDFGDFQGSAREDGSSTPTGSWTFEDSFIPAEKDSLDSSPAVGQSKDLPSMSKGDTGIH